MPASRPTQIGRFATSPARTMPVTQKFTRERRCKQYVSQQPQHCTRLMATLPSRVLELHGICMGSGQDRPAPLLFVKTKKLPMTTVVFRCGDEPLQFNNRPDLKLLLRRRRRHSNLAKLCQPGWQGVVNSAIIQQNSDQLHVPVSTVVPVVLTSGPTSNRPPNFGTLFRGI